MRIRPGFKYGKLIVLRRDGFRVREPMWIVECNCGNPNLKRVSQYDLTRGHTTSCGCSRAKRNGVSRHPLYRVWSKMIERCEDSNHVSYRWYGQKGVSVCQVWRRNPVEFIQWALENGWQKGLTIDRLDSSGDYCPENCRFITLRENVRRAYTH